VKLSCSLLSKANGPAPTLPEVFEVLSRMAIRYQDAHQEIPVFVIDNINNLSDVFLSQFQDFTKLAADENIANFVFVSSEGRIPRRMKGTSILS
jgi:hypothetical protein